MSYSQALEEQISLIDRENNVARSFFDSNPEMSGQHRLAAHCLKFADTFYWAPDICRIVQYACDETLDSYVLREEALPTAAGYFWLGAPVYLSKWDGDDTAMRAILWGIFDRNDGCSLATYHYHHGISNPYISLGMVQWRFGDTLEQALERFPADDILRRQWVKDAWRWLAASLIFMEQRILVAPQQRAERHTRKRLAAEGFTHEPLIRVVELRRKQARSEHHGDSEPVEWSHQWIVSGHWRQQWYPSLNTNQPRWIMPYVKGPEDKPLKPPRAKVFAVVR